MTDFATSKRQGKGIVVLKMTSKKELALTKVLHVLEIHKNLISSSMLVKKGLKLAFESDRVVLIKSDMYVGRCYMANDLFKMNVMNMASKTKSSSDVADAEADSSVIINVAEKVNKTSPVANSL